MGVAFLFGYSLILRYIKRFTGRTYGGKNLLSLQVI